MGYNRVLGHFTNSQELAIPWQSGQLYLVNQVVINSNLLYLCATQHTSGASFAADLALGYWTGLNPAATVSISQGGTGQTTQTAAFDALAPTTTAGDIIVHNGTDNVRQAIGTDGQVLVVDTSQPNRLKWSNAPSGNTNFITNGGAEANNTTGWATYAETDAVTFQDTGDTVTLNNHGLSNGNQVAFTVITSTTGISINTRYFVVGATTNTFQVASSFGGSALPLTTNGSGTMVRFAPKTGSGGSPNVTITASGTSPLIGNYSFLLAKDAANREGQGWEYDFTIDSAYRASVLQISFNYLISSGTFVAAGAIGSISDVTVWIYDVTNAVMIQPSSISLFSNNATIADTFNATFQTASNSTSYRLIFHVSTPSTSAYTLKVDGVSVSPSAYVYGSPVTDWQAYTPTLGAGFGTATNISFYWRRVGASAEIKGTFVTGTVAASLGTFTLPNGISIDSTKISISNTSSQAGQLMGSWAQNGSQLYGSIVTATGTSTTLIYCGGQINQSTTLIPTNINTSMNSSQTTSVLFEVPIQGWSSSLQMSNDADTRVVAASYALNATTTFNATVIKFNTQLTDTHGAYNTSTGVYTVPVSGLYKISATLLSTTTVLNATIRKNGTSIVRTADGTTPNDSQPSMSIILQCNAGDTIDFYSQSNTSFYGAASPIYDCYMDICRLSGPSVIAATESVNASYYLSANFAASTTVPINFDTREFDSHNAITPSATAWKFTAPISGVYSVGTKTNVTTVTNTAIDIYKNGSAYKNVGYNYSGNLSNAYTLIRLNAGDYIDVRPNAAITFQGGALTAYPCVISISRVGN